MIEIKRILIMDLSVVRLMFNIINNPLLGV